MAGHSHWTQIKRAKGAADAKRGKIFGKLSRAITVAARMGGGDPAVNLKLRYALDKARQSSMPKDTIERAIKKGIGEGDSSSYDEFAYEGYGPGGVALLIEVATDNRNRTNTEVRTIVEKGGGKLGNPGSVAWMFDRKGYFSVDASVIGEDSLMELALEAGAEDVRPSDGNHEVICDPTLFSDVQDALAEKGLELPTAEITQLPNAPIDVDADTARKVITLMDKIDEQDDVQSVYSNMNLTDELMSDLQDEE